MYCPQGFARDANDCEMCQCAQAEDPGLNCRTCILKHVACLTNRSYFMLITFYLTFLFAYNKLNSELVKSAGPTGHFHASRAENLTLPEQMSC